MRRNIPNHYATLGVPPQASMEDIKLAYRKLALRLHPDVNPSISARSQFVALQQAYEVLGNPQARQQYDRQRIQGMPPPVARAQRPAHTTRPPRAKAYDPATDPEYQKRKHLGMARGLLIFYFLAALCIFGTLFSAMLFLKIMQVAGVYMDQHPGLGLLFFGFVIGMMHAWYFMGRWLLRRYDYLLARAVIAYHRRFYNGPQ